MLIKNALALGLGFEFEEADVITDGGRIAKVCKEGVRGGDSDETIDAGGMFLLPGLFDIHTHGAAGLDFMDVKEESDYSAISAYMYKNGVLNFVPTVITAPLKTQCGVLGALGGISNVRYIHLEGPYIEKEKRGAHNKRDIRPFDFSEMREMIKASNGKIKLITAAGQDSHEYIRWLKEQGIIVSIGHTTTTYEEANLAFGAGVTNVTHIFNAMNGIGHREPGVIGAAFDDPNIYCEVIGDGVHLHPSVVRMLYRVLGSDRMILISDSMSATGIGDGQYFLGGNKVYVDGGVAKNENGNIAGSTKNLFEMVKSVVGFGIPLNEAVKMASYTPARALGIDDIGAVAEGMMADMLIVDRDLNIKTVIKNGRVV